MEQARSKPLSDSEVFFKGIAGFAIAAMVMLGVGGTVYNLVAPGGWLAQIFGRSFAGGLAAILALFIVGGCACVVSYWVSAATRNRHSGLFVYGFATAGVLYAVQYLTKGGF
jgi:hypothetical protein